jgi:hypothetical protein
MGLRISSKVCVSGCSGEARDISDVVDASEHHDQPLEAEAEAAVRDCAMSSEIQVPPIVFLGQLQFFDSFLKNFQDLLSLGSTDDFSHFRSQDVECSYSLAIAVLFHIECFDFLGVVIQNDRFVEDMVAKIALVFGSQVVTPVNIFLEDNSFGADLNYKITTFWRI